MKNTTEEIVETSLFPSSHWIDLERAKNRLHAEGRSVIMLVFTIFVQFLAFFLVIAIDIAVLWELFVGIKGMDVPGEEKQWNVAVLACSGLVLIILYKVIAIKHPRSRVVKMIEYAAIGMMPLYVAGAGLAFAVVMYQSGTDMWIDNGAGGLNFSTDGGEEETSIIAEIIEKYLIPPFALLFNIAVGCMATMSLVAASILGTWLHENIRQLSLTMGKRRRANKIMSRLRKLNQRYSALGFDLQEQVSQSDAEFEARTVTKIQLALNEPMRHGKRFLAQIDLTKGMKNEHDITATAQDRMMGRINPEALRKKVAAFEEITEDVILSLIKRVKTTT